MCTTCPGCYLQRVLWALAHRGGFARIAGARSLNGLGSGGVFLTSSRKELVGGGGVFL